MRKNPSTRAFTLIELSIVLVIIGLIIGGVLVGQALIKNAERNAILSQLEQLKIASNTFKNKYKALPGDMHVSKTGQFGFFTMTGSSAGIDEAAGNGSGIISVAYLNQYSCMYEGAVFFRHLAEAGLIGLDTSQVPGADIDNDYVGTIGSFPLFEFNLYLPATKSGAYICANNLSAHSDFWSIASLGSQPKNIFFLTGPAKAERESFTEPSMLPIDLYAIDLKIDDGMPLRGRVLNDSFMAHGVDTDQLWNSTAGSNYCVYGGASQTDTAQQYNANSSSGGNSISCKPVFLW